jgi:hypothetical protein
MNNDTHETVPKAPPCLTKPAAGRPEVPIHQMRSFV